MSCAITTSLMPCRTSFPSGLRGLVFDIDGVLFDSRESNMVFYNSVRKALGLPRLSPQEEDFCQMASVDESFNAIIPPELRDAAFAACETIDYRRDILPMIAPEPGLLDLLRRLEQWNVPRAIFTNRSSSVEELLHFFNLESFFSPIKTAANTRPKPHPDGLLSILDEWNLESGQIAFLGDSPVDEQAADAAGVPFWAFRNPKLRASVHIPDFFRLITSITPLVEG